MQRQNKKPIIFSNDAAIDDVIALLYLLAHPECELAGITVTGAGEAHGYCGAQNIARLCHYLGYKNIPIAYSGDRKDPYCHPFPDWLRGLADNLIINLPISAAGATKISANSLALIKQILDANYEPCLILATGPLTDIAAFIQQYPEYQSKIEKIVIMGGAVDVPGNIQAIDENSDNTVAEWNIYADPQAAKIVFESALNIELVSLDATNQVPMTEAFYNSLGSVNSKSCKIMHTLLTDLINHLPGGMPAFVKDFYLWDPLAAMLALERHLAERKTYTLKIDLSTAQTAHSATGKMITVNTKILQPNLILEQFVNTLLAGEHSYSVSRLFQPENLLPKTNKAYRASLYPKIV